MSVDDAGSDPDIQTELVKQAQLELPYNMTTFQILANQHYQWMCNLSTGIVSDSSMAQSLAQDALLRAMHGLPRLNDPEKFRSWLGTITINVSKAHLTRERKEASKRERFALEPVQNNLMAEPFDSDFHEMIAPLTTDEKALVCLRILNEFDFQEIAVIIGLELSATKMRYYRALEKIKQSLG